MKSHTKLAKSKKGFEMSWSVIAWIIIGLIALFILLAIIKKGSTPAFGIFDSL